MARAAGLADIVSNKFGNKVDVDLIPSSGGVFEVSLDGNLIYSKQKTGRFPNQQEIDDIMSKIEHSS
ncbi:MAG: SelT/SelW/SelH family protein [Candidatus Poribacteria bacterium]